MGLGSVASSAAWLCTAGWLATASWLCTANRLAAVAAVFVEQTLKKALCLRCTSSFASACGLSTASRLAGSFATASRLTRSFTAACWFYVTRVTTLVTKLVKQAERASVGGARSNHCDCHQSRNDYTTHREISMELGTGEGFARLEPQHVRAANGQNELTCSSRSSSTTLVFGRSACCGATGEHQSVRCSKGAIGDL